MGNRVRLDKMSFRCIYIPCLTAGRRNPGLSILLHKFLFSSCQKFQNIRKILLLLWLTESRKFALTNLSKRCIIEPTSRVGHGASVIMLCGATVRRFIVRSLGACAPQTERSLLCGFCFGVTPYALRFTIYGG